jgi:CBS domain-containing protein
MKTIKQLLAESPRTPLSIAPGASVYAALELMANNNVGALLVMDAEKLVGICSERDYARKVVLSGKSSRDTPVSEIMTEKVFYALPTQMVDEAMNLMTEKRIRHLPVMDGNRILGVISMGDLVKETISDQAYVIQQLEHYIAS